MPVQVGALYPLECEVRNSAGTLVNPTSSLLVITNSATGLPVTPAPVVTNPSTGLLRYDYPTTVAGRFVATWTTTGPVTAKSYVFNVEPADPGWIVTLEDVKAHMNMSRTDNDAELERHIAAATAKIEAITGPVVPRLVVERHRHLRGATSVRLLERPVLSLVSAAAVDGSVSPLTVGDLDLDPDTGRVFYGDGSYLPAGWWEWTYRAGRAVIEQGLQLAALNFVRDSWKTQRGAGRNALGNVVASDDPQQVPGMGLVVYRLKQELEPYALPGAGIL